MKFIDITGKKFGKLLVIDKIKNQLKNKGNYWNCLCDCGNYYKAKSSKLRNGKTSHCGCCSTKHKIKPGDKFNKWIVLKEIPLEERKLKFKTSGVYYECVCECGNISTIKSTCLVNNRTKSCGCIKEIVSPEANFNSLYKHYQYSAKKRQKLFNLTKEEFRKLTSENCTYCGNPPSSIMVQKLKKSVAIPYIYNGIDRVDSNLNYDKDNCITSCSICNKMKLDYTREEFLSKIEQIFNNMCND